jgi:hypothetical protein
MKTEAAIQWNVLVCREGAVGGGGYGRDAIKKWPELKCTLASKV